MDVEITTFLTEKKQDLIQIYINERIRSNNLEGILMLTKINNNINVSYFDINNMPLKLKEVYIKHRENHNYKNNVIHFYICESEDKAYMMNIEL